MVILTLSVRYFVLVLGSFLICMTSFAGFRLLIAFNPFTGFDNFTISLTSCSGCCSMVSSYVVSCLKAGLAFGLLRSVQLLLLVVDGVAFPSAVFMLLCLQCFEVSVYVMFCVLCRSCGSCFTCAGLI